jgi:hypothetical protein
VNAPIDVSNVTCVFAAAPAIPAKHVARERALGNLFWLREFPRRAREMASGMVDLSSLIDKSAVSCLNEDPRAPSVNLWTTGNEYVCRCVAPEVS